VVAADREAVFVVGACVEKSVEERECDPVCNRNNIHRVDMHEAVEVDVHVRTWTDDDRTLDELDHTWMDDDERDEDNREVFQWMNCYCKDMDRNIVVVVDDDVYCCDIGMYIHMVGIDLVGEEENFQKTNGQVAKNYVSPHYRSS